MNKHTTHKIVNEELSNILDTFSHLDFLDIQWQCPCHCGLVIHNIDADITSWLRYDDTKDRYVINSTIPEESFAGQKNQYMSLLELYNLINEYNISFPENAIYNIELDIAPLAMPKEA